MPARYIDFCKSGHDLHEPDARAGDGRCRKCRDAYNYMWRTCNREHLRMAEANRVRSPESLDRQIAKAAELRHTRRYDGIVYLGGVCVDCGFKTHLDALQFDHLPERGLPDRKAILGTYGWERMKTELNKCELVCANCHAIRTQSRRGKGVSKIGEVFNGNQIQAA